MLKLCKSTVEKLQAFKDEFGATAIEYGLIAAGSNPNVNLQPLMAKRRH